MAGAREAPYRGAAVEGPPVTNLDLLDWFAPDERGECSACGLRACVSLPDADASFCLGCGAITVGDVRIDVHGLLPGIPA
jgi:hypothetical protein